MKKLLCLLTISLSFTSLYAATQPNVESAINNMLPNTKISKINPGPFDGTYEVIAGSNAFYVNPLNESEVIVGHVINIKTMQDVTQQHLEASAVNKFNFNNLPLDKAIKVGNGKKKLMVFIDPDCPYCQQLEAFLHGQLNNVTVYYMFMPLPMHPQALPHSKQILCANNPTKAIYDIMVNKVNVADGSSECQAKADETLKDISTFAIKNDIRSTPYIITDKNQVINGFDTQALQKFIGEGK